MIHRVIHLRAPGFTRRRPHEFGGGPLLPPMGPPRHGWTVESAVMNAPPPPPDGWVLRTTHLNTPPRPPETRCRANAAAPVRAIVNPQLLLPPGFSIFLWASSSA